MSEKWMSEQRDHGIETEDAVAAAFAQDTQPQPFLRPE